MNKILGNKALLFLVLMGHAWAYSASIALRITEINGRTALKAVGVGQPFVLELRMNDFGESRQAVAIPGLDALSVQQTQERYTMINGQVSNQYMYVCRVDKPGSYTVGPVKVIHKGVEVESNTLVFEADEKIVPVSDKARKRKQEKAAVFLRFSVDNDRVVVGQKIACTLRLYYTDAVVAIHSVQRPELPGFTLGDFVRAESGQEQMNGVEYTYVDFVGHLYATAAGKKMIPAFSVDYEIQAPQKGSSFFDFMFFNKVKRERVYSNATHLMIDELPPIEPIGKKVDGIGEFKTLAIKLDSSGAKIGEGLTLTVELEGEGNLEQVNQFDLIGLDESIKYYESKKYGDAGKKSFEFVVQGLSAGKKEILAQQFTYFDVRQKKYVTLRSSPVYFTVMPSGSVASPASSSILSSGDVGENAPESTQDSIQDTDSANPVLDQLPLGKGLWYPVKERSPLPWWLFAFACMVPFLVGMYRLLVRRAGDWRYARTRALKAKRAFADARAELETCRKNNDMRALYPLLMRLIARRRMVSDTIVSRSWVANMLEQKKCTAQEIEAWEHFLDTLTYYSFAQAHVPEGAQGAHDEGIYDSKIYDSMTQWIAWLEKKL